MKRILFAVGSIFAMSVAFLTPAAQASTITLTAVLSGAFEVPAVPSSGAGFATVVLDTTANTLFLNVSFSGLTGLTTASHIHCCAVPGANAGVATQTPTFANLPLGVTSGTFTQLLDLTLPSSYNPAFITAQGGTLAGAEAGLIAGMLAGDSYLNIHTSSFPGGEIRGLLTPTPEPSSFLLLGSGFLGLVGTRIRAGRRT